MSHCDEDDKREQALNIRSSVDEILTVKDLVVLIQLFYLPNEHGQVRPFDGSVQYRRNVNSD